MAWTWGGSGSVATIDWGGRAWTLDLGAPIPGLQSEEIGPLLALDGLCAPGRRDATAFSAASLQNVERRFGRIEATFTPAGWADLKLRASWGLHGEDAIDLEIQLSAHSVDELRRIEVMVANLWHRENPATQRRWVEPRDARAASLSYDGREPHLDRLTTFPVDPDALRGPWTMASPATQNYCWEMAHPDDVTRRIFENESPHWMRRSCRYGLFGHDLERGVTLRGRLRAGWLPMHAGSVEAGDLARLTAEFLGEPPPLGP